MWRGSRSPTVSSTWPSFSCWLIWLVLAGGTIAQALTLVYVPGSLTAEQLGCLDACVAECLPDPTPVRPVDLTDVVKVRRWLAGAPGE